MAFSSSRVVRGKDNSDYNSPLIQALKGDNNLPASHPHMTVHHITEPVGSTQDEARRLLSGKETSTATTTTNLPFNNVDNNHKFLAVVADQQQAGRGTNGRTWESSQGNLYLTVCLPMTQIPVMLTLLPLQIAVLVADRAETILRHYAPAATATEALPVPRVRVKWPNDVLVNDAKLSGTLIENFNTPDESWFLIGIGVNVQHAPPLTASPGKQIRPAVSLQQLVCVKNNNNPLPPRTALCLGTDLAYALADWAMVDHGTRDQANQAVLQAWKAKADFGTRYEIRSNNVDDETTHNVIDNNNDNTTTTSNYQGEIVVALDLAPDGQLKVRGANGKERLLVSDYFF